MVILIPYGANENAVGSTRAFRPRTFDRRFGSLIDSFVLWSRP
jgi:hypothetical protein